MQVLEDELAEAKMTASKSNANSIALKSNYEIQVAELNSRINEMEEEALIESGRARIAGNTTHHKTLPLEGNGYDCQFYQRILSAEISLKTKVNPSVSKVYPKMTCCNRNHVRFFENSTNRFKNSRKPMKLEQKTSSFGQIQLHCNCRKKGPKNPGLKKCCVL